jgi:hypothetical protein
MKLRPVSLATSLGALSLLCVPLLTATPFLAFADDYGAPGVATPGEASAGGPTVPDAEPVAEAAPAEAAPPAAEAKAPPEPPPGFEAVTGPGAAQADVDPIPLVIVAYLFIWAMVLVYLVLLWRRQSRVNEEIQSLAQRLERAAGE